MTVGVRVLPTDKLIPMRVAYDEEEGTRAARFRAIALPYVDDVYSLARYLLGNTADAEDATQEAFLRAFRHFDTPFQIRSATGQHRRDGGVSGGGKGRGQGL